MRHFPTKVLLATDGSEDAALAAKAASDLCGKAGSELHVVHVGQDISDYARYIAAPERYSFIFAQEARELLDKQVASITQAGGAVAEAYLELGDPGGKIIDLAEELEVSLVIMGSRGLGPVKRLVLGSTSEEVIHRAPCPVLVVRGGSGAWPPGRILMGDDGSEAAKEAEEIAAGIGKLSEAKGLLVRAYPRLPEMDVEGREFDARMIDDELHREQRTLEDRAAILEDTLGVRPRVMITVGDPAAALLETAEEGTPEKTLIAVGSRGLGAVQRIRLGSISTKVLHAAKGPVLVYAPHGR